MPLLNWSNGLDIGVNKMNDEHKVLLDLMNKLYDMAGAGKGKAELSKALKELGEYTVKHFSDEEEYMRSISFPEFELHQFIHKDLLGRFQGHVKEFEAGDGKMSESFFGFLKLWLSAHIQGIDKKYGDYAKKNKAA